jgi:carbon storage regulator
MLVLSRTKNEKIRVGDDIIIQIVSIGPNRVKIGVQSPKETPIWREEVYHQILREKGTVKSLVSDK